VHKPVLPEMTYLEFDAVLERVEVKVARKQRLKIESSRLDWRKINQGIQVGGLSLRDGLETQAISVNYEITDLNEDDLNETN